MIGKILREVSRNEELYDGQDFIKFLQNVVRADCEIEGDDDDGDQGKKTNKDRAKFFMVKYGGKKQTAEDMKKSMPAANKFSLSRVEWLESVFTASE